MRAELIKRDGRMEERGIGVVVVIAIVVIVAIAAGSVYVIMRGGYPVISVTVQSFDSEIRIYVSEGSIAAGEWACSVSATSGNYTWVIGNEPLDPISVGLGTYTAGKWYVSLKHINSGHIYFSDEPVTIPAEGYPAVAVTAALSGDNEIVLNVLSGSIAAGEWAYSVSPTVGSYSWVTGTEVLDAPSVSLGTYAPGTWFVNVKHIDSGYIYFTTDQVVTISPAIPPSAMLTVVAEKSAPNTVRLTISHEGGDDLSVADLQIKATNDAAGGMTTIAGADLNVGTTLSVGESGSISYTYNGVDVGTVITVYIIHVPSGQKIFSSSSIVVR